MYYNSEPNWIKILPNKDIYIFGGGKKGELANKKIETIGNCRIIGVIDNSSDVVSAFNNGDGWCSKAYSLCDYKRIKKDSDIIIISTSYTEISKQLIDENIYNFVSVAKIDFYGVGEDYYNEEYFNMQLEYAKVDSEIDREFFQKYIPHNAHVAEFGSGGGLLLEKLDCAKKIGIEINPVAIKYANSIGIPCVDKVDDLEDESIDICISSHALEHCLSPYEIICKIKKKLKHNGKAIFVVPYEPLAYGYELNNVSQHLFNWTERSLGNLFHAAGFFIRETGVKEVAWPNNWKSIYESSDKDVFNALSVLESDRVGYYSVYVVGENG